MGVPEVRKSCLPNLPATTRQNPGLFADYFIYLVPFSHLFRHLYADAVTFRRFCHRSVLDLQGTIKKVRQLRIVILNQLRATGSEYQNYLNLKKANIIFNKWYNSMISNCF
ncbi:hypothetical protein JY97_02465 [Alkalispirochaeta odontotermitis]|nr:hypothetical protein JY97_02465 [Alkalispirochaeta odontotermitis]CAB1079584.1 hypothetical protein D1AOALGA4SA_7292 [Olavius algarvensis Delta 1 endosymbiont]